MEGREINERLRGLEKEKKMCVHRHKKRKTIEEIKVVKIRGKLSEVTMVCY